MRTGIVLMVIMGVAFTAMAQDLGSSRKLPVKNTPIVTYEPPAVPRQGGDTIEDAILIPGLRYSTTGTTAGYNNDYDEVCPYTGSTSPDVVYSFTPVVDVDAHIDLCGSVYDCPFCLSIRVNQRQNSEEKFTFSVLPEEPQRNSELPVSLSNIAARFGQGAGKARTGKDLRKVATGVIIQKYSK